MTGLYQKNKSKRKVKTNITRIFKWPNRDGLSNPPDYSCLNWASLISCSNRSATERFWELLRDRGPVDWDRRGVWSAPIVILRVDVLKFSESFAVGTDALATTIRAFSDSSPTDTGVFVTAEELFAIEALSVIFITWRTPNFAASSGVLFKRRISVWSWSPSSLVR